MVVAKWPCLACLPMLRGTVELVTLARWEGGSSSSNSTTRIIIVGSSRQRGS